MEISWHQRDYNKLIISIKNDQREKQFQLTDAVINFLASHRHVFMYVVVNGTEENACLVNFSGIKPISKEPKGYGLKSLNKEVREADQPDKCAIARGETFSARWLTPKGWSAEKHYFAMQSVDDPVTAEKIDCPSCGRQIKASSHFCGYCGEKVQDAHTEKVCINTACGKKIRANAKFCTYCGEKQS